MEEATDVEKLTKTKMPEIEPEDSGKTAEDTGGAETSPLIAAETSGEEDDSNKYGTAADEEIGLDRQGEAESGPGEGADTTEAVEEEKDFDFTTSCHAFFITVSSVSLLTLLAMIIAQLLLFFSEDDFFSQLLRAYIIIFCFLFMFVELEWPTWISHKLIGVNNWMVRGLIYSFIGLVGMEESSTVLATKPFSLMAISVFIGVSSWVLVGVGVLYLLLGMLCMRSLKEKVRDDYYEKKEKGKQDIQSQAS